MNKAGLMGLHGPQSQCLHCVKQTPGQALSPKLLSYPKLPGWPEFLTLESSGRSNGSPSGWDLSNLSLSCKVLWRY